MSDQSPDESKRTGRQKRGKGCNLITNNGTSLLFMNTARAKYQQEDARRKSSRGAYYVGERRRKGGGESAVCQIEGLG
jgi:hypothetical protein